MRWRQHCSFPPLAWWLGGWLAGWLAAFWWGGRVLFRLADVKEIHHAPRGYVQVEEWREGAAGATSVVIVTAVPSPSDRGAHAAAVQSVVDASAGAKALVYCSSAGVVAGSGSSALDLRGADEAGTSLQPAAACASASEAAHAAAELAVNRGSVASCIVRPANVYGPGEVELLPFLASTGPSGGPSGGGQSVDFTFSGNAAHALLQAADALVAEAPGRDEVKGQAFFVSDGEPVPARDFARDFLEGMGYESAR